MGAAIRLDWVRITTVRSTALIIGTMLALGFVVAALLALSFRDEALDPELAAILITNAGSLNPLPFLAIFMGILGTLMVGHDYRHGLVHPVLIAVPRRWAVVFGRMIVLAAIALVTGIVAVAINAGIGAILLGHLPIDASVVQASAGYVLLGVLWAWLGAGATWLLRRTSAAGLILFLVPLVIEPVISGLSLLESLAWLRPIVKWLPFAAGRSLALTGGGNKESLSPVQGGLVFLALVLLVFMAGTTRFATRDA